MKMGAHHTLEIELNNKLTLGKERWDAMHLQELDEATDVHKTSEARQSWESQDGQWNEWIILQTCYLNLN